MANTEFSLAELAANVDGNVSGETDIPISGISTLASARSGELSFLSGSIYKKYLAGTQATAVLLKKEDAPDCPVISVVVADPYVAYAKLSGLFVSRVDAIAGIHSAAQVHESAILGSNVFIGAQCVIEAGAKIGSGTSIAAGCFIGAHSEIGEGGRLFPNVVIYSGVSLGSACCIHAGTVIGADGFGYAREDDVPIKIAQLGGVEIGNNVEIGANTTIDRGALDNTVIGNNVKIDNQVQIAHNVEIGENTIICGCTAIAGSTHIGRNCTLGGAVGVTGHLTLADGVMVTAMSLVTSSITSAGVYSSGTGIQPNEEWRKSAARFRQLDELARRVQKIEKK